MVPEASGSPIGRTVTLDDGRRLALMEHCRTGAKAVFVFHGLPGSRLPTGAEAELAKAGDLRLITVDRPGIGLSDYQPGRRITDWPHDVARMADELGIGRFSIVGVSAGGAYALACGCALEERLDKVVLVNSMAPLDLAGVAGSLSPFRRFGYRLVRHVPGQAWWVAWLQCRAVRKDPEALLRRISKSMSRRDRELLADRESWIGAHRHVAEAYRQGPAGVACEIRLIARPWGFDLADVVADVHLVHGELDRNVPVAAARLLAASLPRCRATYNHDQGHLSTADSLRQVVAALDAPRVQ